LHTRGITWLRIRNRDHATQIGDNQEGFSDEQELEIVKVIGKNFIAPGQLSGDNGLKLLATQRFAEHVLTAGPEPDFDQFKDLVCYPRFIPGFKRRHHLCSRNPWVLTWSEPGVTSVQAPIAGLKKVSIATTVSITASGRKLPHQMKFMY
jgi:hypothetical protein